MTTLDESKIAAYLAGSLAPSERAAVEAALDREPEWLRVVAVMARDRQTDEQTDEQADDQTLGESVDEGWEPPERVTLAPGTRVGRFEVLRRIATGGMGVVHEAWDATLHRQVALKIARTRPRDPKARERQLREARTLAQLSAPNVVAVYDAGEHEGRIYVAMEKLEGATLRSHLGAARAGTGLSLRELVGLFVEAAQGLHAAHRKGIVHRDFKAENVIVEADRVVVVDFGLALRAVDERVTVDETAALAQTHSVAGTPAYMAPEQRRGEAVTARSDQYSLCVALAEALDDAELRVPPGVRAVLERGRAEDPASRFADLGRLISALERALGGPKRWGRIAGLALGVASVAVVGGLSGALMVHERAPSAGELLPGEMCEAARAELEGTWNREVRGGLEARLRSFDKAYLDDMVAPLGAAIDARAGLWTQARLEACVSHELGLDSAETHDLRVACLERRRAELDLFLSFEWDEGEASNAARSLTALAELSPAAVCDDLELLRAATPLPEDPRARAEVSELRRGLAEVELLHRARRLEEAKRRARELLDRASDLGYEPVLAELRSELGWILVTGSEHEDAAEEFDAALLLAEATHHDPLITQIWVRRLWSEGYIRADVEGGREAEAHARAWLQRTGQPAALRFDFYCYLGWFESESGDAQVALESFEQALELAGDSHTEALAHSGLGAALMASGDVEGAALHVRRAMELTSELLGEDHPDTAKARNNLAGLLRVLGEFQECRRLFIQNLETFTQAYGPDHDMVGKSEFNLAIVSADLGEHEASLDHARAAATNFAASLGEEHSLTLAARASIAATLIELGRLDAGVSLMREILDAQARSLGPDHPKLGITHHNLGVGLADAGRHDEALVEYARALEILEASKGGQHYMLATVLVNFGLAHEGLGHAKVAESAYRRALDLATPGSEPEARSRLGRLLIAEGQRSEGLAELERALEDHRKLDADGVFVAQSAYNLGRALWEGGEEDRARALALTREAIVLYDQNGDDISAEDARAWLDERGG